MTDSQLSTAIAAAVAKAIGRGDLNKPNHSVRKGRKGKKAKANLTDAEKAIYMAQNDAKCVEAFTKAGFKDVQPRVNVLTYDKWVAQGRLVRKGEKAVRVGPFALFHRDQTSEIPVTAESPAANTVAA